MLPNSMSNVPPVKGDALADMGATPEDALRAVTENRITKILAKIKEGVVKKAS
jgi:hypothetical protein